MNRNYLSIASVILSLTILFALFFQGTNFKFNQSLFNPPSPSPSSTTHQNIIVYEPQQNQVISYSFNISGLARVFENTFTFRLKNLRTNNTYAQSSTITDSEEAGVHGKFSFLLNFAGNAPDIKDGDNLLLEVFQFSAQDGSEIDKVSTPLLFQNAEQQKISLHFPNSRLTKDFQCAQVFPVSSNIEKTTDPAKNALFKLLKGPTDNDQSKGYSTNLSPDLIINSFKIESQTVYIDLNKNISQNSDKCKTESAIAQINTTLKQFPEIKNVKITINNIPFN